MSQLSRRQILDRIAAGESLHGINLVRADLAGLDMVGADFTEANLRMADLACSDMRDARLTGCFLSGALLDKTNLSGANLVQASMIGCTLKEANLARADISGADLTGANLEGAVLEGAYLVGTFLNETDLTGANLAGVYIRMAQLEGSNLSGASLENADFSHANLSGVRLDDSCMVGANLAGANLSASTLTGADLRHADLTGADLSGCNLTGAKLNGIKFDGIKLADAWAEWVDLSPESNERDRALLEDVFVGIIGKPTAQVLVEGRITDNVYAVVLSHLCEFQVSNSRYADVKLKAINQGIGSSALYLEAEREASLAAYLAALAEIIGKGSAEFSERLKSVIAEEVEAASGAARSPFDFSDSPLDLDDPLGPPPFDLSAPLNMGASAAVGRVPRPTTSARAEALKRTDFWNREKAIVILTGDRQVWFEATSSESLTLHPPRSPVTGVDLVRGRFVADGSRRHRHQATPK